MSEEKKEEKADPMLEMMQRIRSGNVALKKVAPPTQKSDKGGGVMAEMAKLLVSFTNIEHITVGQSYFWCAGH